MMGMGYGQEDNEEMGPRKEALQQLIQAMHKMMMQGYGDDEMAESPKGDMPPEGEEMREEPMGDEMEYVEEGEDAPEGDMDLAMEEGEEPEEDDFKREVGQFMRGERPAASGATMEVSMVSAQKPKGKGKKRRKG